MSSLAGRRRPCTAERFVLLAGGKKHNRFVARNTYLYNNNNNYYYAYDFVVCRTHSLAKPSVCGFMCTYTHTCTHTHTLVCILIFAYVCLYCIKFLMYFY